MLIALALLLLFFAFFAYHKNKNAKQLTAMNEELKHKNEELTVANARAEESSRMKADFIQQISHEIRTPLNILNGFTQVITDQDSEQLSADEKKDIQHRISENSHRITDLVNKMLELSEASSQTVIQRTDHVVVGEIATQAVEDSSICQAVHIHFEQLFERVPATVPLVTNRRYAIRALTLLLDNAQKFTQKGTVRLIVRRQPEAMAFVVEDTGIGIPADQAEHVFEEFVQLDEYYDGTGIGLAVARSIARRLGGDITLDTTYTGGARFIMTLPVEG